MFWGPFVFIGSLSLSFVCNLSGFYVTFNLGSFNSGSHIHHNRHQAHTPCSQQFLGFILTFIHKFVYSNCLVFVFALSLIRDDFAFENVFVFVLLLKMMSLMGRIPESETNGKEQERRQSLACVQLYNEVVFMLVLHSGRWV